METRGSFHTPDPFTAAAIVVITGEMPELILNARGRVSFTFLRNDAVLKAVVAYQDNCSLPALEFAQTQRELRSRMFQILRPKKSADSSTGVGK